MYGHALMPLFETSHINMHFHYLMYFSDDHIYLFLLKSIPDHARFENFCFHFIHQIKTLFQEAITTYHWKKQELSLSSHKRTTVTKSCTSYSSRMKHIHSHYLLSGNSPHDTTPITDPRYLIINAPAPYPQKCFIDKPHKTFCSSVTLENEITKQHYHRTPEDLRKLKYQ